MANLSKMIVILMTKLISANLSDQKPYLISTSILQTLSRVYFYAKTILISFLDIISL